MKNDKFIVQIFGNSFLVASITTAWINCSDTNESHFSFGVFGIEPEQFCCAVDTIIEERYNHKTYYDTTHIELSAGSISDKITFMRNCHYVSINRGGMRVMYYGSVERLVGMTEAIRNEYKKYMQKLEKEQPLGWID